MKRKIEKQDKQFSAALRHVRNAKGLSKKAIAEMAGRSGRMIDYVLKDERGLGKEAAINLVQALGYTYEDFLSLGQWILEGKDSEGWQQSVRAKIEGNLPGMDKNGVMTSLDKPDDQPDLEEFKRRFCIAMAAEIRFVAEEYGTDVLDIEDFRDEFRSRFPEFMEWRKKQKGVNNQAAPQESISDGTDG